MDLVGALVKDVGLSDTEARVYLEGLGRGDMGARELVKRTGVKRPTVYHALETLLQKGLVSKKAARGRTAYLMTPPERIGGLIDRRIALLERQRTSLASLLPHLQRKNEDSKVGATEVSQYEGVEGMKALVEEALYCRSRRWDIIAPRKNFFSEFDKDYARYFMETRRSRGILARSLWEHPDDPARSRALSRDDLRLRQPRYLPKIMRGRFPAVMILFDDKIALLSSSKELSGALIRSTEMHATMTAMFEGLWSVSEPYEKKKDARAARP